MGFYNDLFQKVPVHTGKRIYVAPSSPYTYESVSYSASDGNDGEDPRRAKLTLSSGLGVATASVGDVIILLPGTHTLTASLALDKAGVVITGIPKGYHHPEAKMPISGKKCLSILTISAADEIINVTAADVEIMNIHFVPAATSQAVDFSALATRFRLHDCTFNMSTAEDTATMGVEAVGAGVDVQIDHNYFLVVGNQGPAIRVAGATERLLVDSNTVELGGATSWDDAIEVTTTAINTMIRDNDFLGDGVVVYTDVMDITGATGDGKTFFVRNFAPAGADVIEAAATADYILVNNYIGSAGATGGALVAA